MLNGFCCIVYSWYRKLYWFVGIFRFGFLYVCGNKVKVVYLVSGVNSMFWISVLLSVGCCGVYVYCDILDNRCLQVVDLYLIGYLVLMMFRFVECFC